MHNSKDVQALRDEYEDLVGRASVSKDESTQMNRDTNIVTCPKCNAPMIAEELETHQCLTKYAVDFMYDTGSDKFFCFDGKKWYRWFPEWTAKSSPTRNQQHSKHEDNSTEPKFLIKIEQIAKKSSLSCASIIVIIVIIIVIVSSSIMVFLEMCIFIPVLNICYFVYLSSI